MGRLYDFASRPPLLAHPPAVPLVPDPQLVDAAAYAIASLAGVDWNEMTPSRLDEFRALGKLAATCSTPDGLRLVAYSIAKTCDAEVFVAMPVGLRRSLAEKVMAAVRGAALRVHGVSNPGTHAELVALIAQDQRHA